MDRPTSKQCVTCHVYKAPSEFSRHLTTRDRLYPSCRPCDNRRNREGNLARKFGLTPADYATLLRNQGGTCRLCRAVCPTGRRLSVDHDHATGRVRALLCSHCNTALGLLCDSPYLLRKAADYVEFHQSAHVHNPKDPNDDPRDPDRRL